jgi:SAM-dependent methyltransferase
MAIQDPPLALDAARAALAAEWLAAAPTTPDDVARFYRTSQCQADDQAAWHATPDRQAWTQMLVQVARQAQAQRIVDIGCGAGQDLAALRAALPAAVLAGVEPNVRQREAAARTLPGATLAASVRHAPLEEADLLICCDVLEHVVDPEGFLGAIAERARVGALLFETTATHDLNTPLHLANNIGWHPGRVLDRYGWEPASYGNGRVRVWQRTAVAAPPRAAILLIAYRACSIQTMGAIINLLGLQGTLDAADQAAQVYAGRRHLPWRLCLKSGDGLITRGRAISLSRWWAECNDDVALMVDDDVVFTPDEAELLVARCREKRSIVCGAYPVGDGSHLALRPWDQGGELAFHAEAEPIDIQYAATGFMAFHRDVVDALMASMAWVHEDQAWCFKPLFETMVVPLGQTHALISEDWAISQRARDLGFTIWLDPRVRPIHQKSVEISVNNMDLMAEAIRRGKGAA